MRKCIINSFYKTIPCNRIHVSLSIVDDNFLKINNNDFEYNNEKIHDLRENILHMLSFEDLIRDEQHSDRPILNDDDDQEQLFLLSCKWL